MFLFGQKLQYCEDPDLDSVIMQEFLQTYFFITGVTFSLLKNLSTLMALEGVSYGWIIILIGAILFGLEVFSPGFFLLVPGTVLIIIGILVLLGIDIFSSGYGIIIGIGIAIIAAALTVYMYSRLSASDEKPLATSKDSLVGKDGRVITEVDEISIRGKVSIEGQIFSARSEKGLIPKDLKVKVIASQGVHIIVEQV